MTAANIDYREADYLSLEGCPRPSHADWTYIKKYNIKSASGGGRSSARETIGRICASAIADKYMKMAHGIEVVAFVESVCRDNMNIAPKFPEDVNEETINAWKQKCKKFWKFLDTITREEVDKNEVRCPDEDAAVRIKNRILKARDQHVSAGGTILCVIRNVPAGLGEPCFDKLEAQLASAMLSIPASKSFEIGSGTDCAFIPSDLHNDPFYFNDEKKTLGTLTNFSGGIQGGISNGENIYFRVAFKPAPTIGIPQQTVKYTGEPSVLEAAGRHDPCVLPRAVPIVESMASLVIMDALMAQYQRIACLEHIQKVKSSA